jgi:hypothetical protein
MSLFFDCETRATSDPKLIARLKASVQPPGNISKAETLAAWWKDKAPTAQLEAIQQTSLNGAHGRLASFAWATNDNAVKCVYGDDEVGMLHSARLAFMEPERGQLVAFNGEFDLRFLMQRMIINGVTVPSAIRAALSQRDGFFDPMKEWAGFRGYIKQVDLERALGILREYGDITGADVGAAIDACDWGAVERHNVADVENLRAIYLRMTQLTWVSLIAKSEAENGH